MKILIPRARGMAGLGALPAYPPASMLKPGMQWVRYYQKDRDGRDIPTHQALACPADAAFGCWMYGGYAWGQVPTINEFQQTATAVPTAAEIARMCSDSYAAWKKANPLRAACLTAEDQYKFAGLCSEVLKGALDKAVMQSQWAAYVDKRCHAKCNRAYRTWRDEHPKQAKCVPYDEGHARYMRICLRVIAGELSPEQGTKNWNTWVYRWCEAAAPSPAPPPPGGEPPPDDRPTDGGGGGGGGPTDAPDDGSSSFPPGSGAGDSGELVDSIIKGDGMDAGGGNGGADAGAEKSLLRRVGPIVGIGLVLAVGGVSWWQYRMKKKGRRR